MSLHDPCIIVCKLVGFVSLYECIHTIILMGPITLLQCPCHGAWNCTGILHTDIFLIIRLIDVNNATKELKMNYLFSNFVEKVSVVQGGQCQWR